VGNQTFGQYPGATRHVRVGDDGGERAHTG
jgi:hypothetical protein